MARQKLLPYKMVLQLTQMEKKKPPSYDDIVSPLATTDQ